MCQNFSFGTKERPFVGRISGALILGLVGQGLSERVAKTSLARIPLRTLLDSGSPQRALQRWGLSSPHLRCDGVGVQRAQKLTQPHTFGRMAVEALELQYLSAE